MQPIVQHGSRQPSNSSAGAPKEQHGNAITPSQMAKAGVPLALARWYHCVGTKLRTPDLLDEVRLAQVRFTVGIAHAT